MAHFIANRVSRLLARCGKSLDLSTTPYVVIATQERSNERSCRLEGCFHVDEGGAIVTDGDPPCELIGMAIGLVGKLLANPELLVLSSHRRCYAAKLHDEQGDWIVVSVAAATEVQAQRVVEQITLLLND